jgi:uncharacterized protein
VFAVPGPVVFRLVVAAVLLPLGLWLCVRTLKPARPQPWPSARSMRLLAFAVGVVGGIYGIGGGSLLGPVLVGRGMPVAKVAPAALAATFVTSIAGVAAYTIMSLTTTGDIAPNWLLGLSCGLGGLIGGYIGARLQPRVPERALRLTLGMLAITLAGLYLAEALAQPGTGVGL